MTCLFVGLRGGAGGGKVIRNAEEDDADTGTCGTMGGLEERVLVGVETSGESDTPIVSLVSSLNLPYLPLDSQNV